MYLVQLAGTNVFSTVHCKFLFLSYESFNAQKKGEYIILHERFNT